MKNYKTIIDVRTPAEFIGGSVAGSMNIPLSEIYYRAEEIKQMQQPLLLCCASGVRSSQATEYLQSIGIDCENGGSWLDVNFVMNENKV